MNNCFSNCFLTEPEVNNCFSIFTRSDLNRIRQETIEKRVVWLTGEFMREHEAINRCAKVKSLQYLQTWQMIVLPTSEKKNRALFVSVNSPRLRKFSLPLLANAVNRGYDQGERCLSQMFFALFTYLNVQFSPIFAFLFSP